MEQALEYIYFAPEPPTKNASTRVPRSFPLHVTPRVGLRTIFGIEGASRVCSSVLGSGTLGGSLILRSRSTHTKPISVYDTDTGHSAKVRVFLDADRSDNPMQSEAACHVGAKGNRNCRKCDNGGTSAEKESDAGYHKLFFVSFHSSLTIAYYPLNVIVGWETSVLD